MNRSQFLASLHDLFEVDAGSIHEDTILQQIESWSSLSFIGLIALIDDECGVSLSPGEILKCLTVGDLLDSIEAEQSPLRMAA